MWYAPVGGSVMVPKPRKTVANHTRSCFKTMCVNDPKLADNTTMQIEKTFETVESPETLKEGQWYWNSWDGEMFVVIDMEKGLSEAGDTVTVAYDNGDIELFNPAALKVDFERIHPVEVSV